MEAFKCVIVGDYGVGRATLLSRYLTDEYPDNLNRGKMGDNPMTTVALGDKSYTLHLVNATGGEEFHRLRPLIYPNTSIFLVCFSVDSLKSFANITESWIPELAYHCSKVPRILVGTKIDLRNDPTSLARLEANGEKFITFEEGEKLARDINAVRYMECSAVTKEGLTEIFYAAAIAALENSINRKKKKRRHCICV